ARFAAHVAHGLERAQERAQRREQEQRDGEAEDREDRAAEPAAQVRADERGAGHDAPPAGAGRAALFWSSAPFSRWSVRPAPSAALGSCVTRTVVVWYSRLSRSRSWRISSAALLSRSPVGSSARISVGSVTIARAMPTRCSCPPESRRG